MGGCRGRRATGCGLAVMTRRSSGYGCCVSGAAASAPAVFATATTTVLLLIIIIIILVRLPQAARCGGAEKPCLRSHLCFPHRVSQPLLELRLCSPQSPRNRGAGVARVVARARAAPARRPPWPPGPSGTAGRWAGVGRGGARLRRERSSQARRAERRGGRQAHRAHHLGAISPRR